MMAFGDDFFKGYISLTGEHIKDGLTKRPVPFSIEDGQVVLRWIHPTGLRNPAYECETRMSRKHALSWNYHFNEMTMGISALEALKDWREQANQRGMRDENTG